MESNKKFVIIMSFIGVIIVGLLIVFLAIPSPSIEPGNQIDNDVVNEPDKDTDDDNNDDVVDSEPEKEEVDVPTFTKLDDYDVFFSLNSLISDYYSGYTIENYDKVMNILDNEYRIRNNIKKENVKNLLNGKIGELTFNSKIIYARENKQMVYYFMQGDIIEVANILPTDPEHMGSESRISEEENICFLIIRDKVSNTFSITPLPITTDLYTYAQNYKIKNKTISSNKDNNFRITKQSDEMITRRYISYFLNIMYINTEKAFNMLETSYKNSFGTLQNFTYNLDNINGKISSNFLGFNVSGEKGSRIYNVQMRNDARMVITEEGIMNLKIKIS